MKINRTGSCRRLWLLVVAAAVLACSVGTRAVEPIAPKNFDRLHKLIGPRDVELLWMKIPWGTDLWSARQKAADAGKPILLWEMDGHPMGCT